MLNLDNVNLFWLQNELLSFALSALLAGIIIPKIILIAFRKNLFDEMYGRKLHHNDIPRLGGIAFFPAMLFSFAFVVAINLRIGSETMIMGLVPKLVPVLFEVCAIILLYLLGIADDLIGVRYRAKFAVQIVSGILLICSGMYISDLYGILWIYKMPAWISICITVFIVVYVVNAINLIDGIDGLASGLSIMALIFYAVVLFLYGEYLYSTIASATAGTLIPFFYYNVFGDARKQKKIFMGDTGALTAGMVLVFCVVAVMSSKVNSVDLDYNPAILAISPLIIPCFDVCRVYFHRVRKHRNPFLPDKCHIHHKLLALGLSQSSALLLILVASGLFMVLNVFLSPYVNPTLLLLCDILLWTVGNMIITRGIRHREQKTGLTLYE